MTLICKRGYSDIDVLKYIRYTETNVSVCATEQMFWGKPQILYIAKIVCEERPA
jgi:hypothetical protein